MFLWEGEINLKLKIEISLMQFESEGKIFD